MNVSVLIDLIVQQTTVLIAEMATSAGLRAPLSQVANQVFLGLVQELERQGVTQRVIADMFGVALRTYQRKVSRLTEATGESSVSLWEAVLSYLRDNSLVTKAKVLTHFYRDDEAMVRSVLRDLVDTGLVFSSGSGENMVFRAVSDDELDAVTTAESHMGLGALITVLTYRYGAMTLGELNARLAVDEGTLLEVLEALVESGELDALPVDDASEAKAVRYRASEFKISLGDTGERWAAAFFDHYQALVTTLIQKSKLIAEQQRTGRADTTIGGSTYTFELWDGHPEAATIRGLLDRARDMAADARALASTNGEPPSDATNVERLTFYVGQNLIGLTPEGPTDRERLLAHEAASSPKDPS